MLISLMTGHASQNSDHMLATLRIHIHMGDFCKGNSWERTHCAKKKTFYINSQRGEQTLSLHTDNASLPLLGNPFKDKHQPGLSTSLNGGVEIMCLTQGSKERSPT